MNMHTPINVLASPLMIVLLASGNTANSIKAVPEAQNSQPQKFKPLRSKSILGLSVIRLLCIHVITTVVLFC